MEARVRRCEGKMNKKEIGLLKKIKFGLESMLLHNQFNFMALHTLGYSGSLKDYFNVWRVKRDIKKIDKQIAKLTKNNNKTKVKKK